MAESLLCSPRGILVLGRVRRVCIVSYSTQTSREAVGLCGLGSYRGFGYGVVVRNIAVDISVLCVTYLCIYYMCDI